MTRRLQVAVFIGIMPQALPHESAQQISGAGASTTRQGPQYGGAEY